MKNQQIISFISVISVIFGMTSCLLLSACGVHSAAPTSRDSNGSLLVARDRHDHETLKAPKNLILRQDLRPTDGALTVLSLHTKDSLTYEVNITSTIINRRTGKSVTSNDVIGQTMNCAFTAGDHDRLHRVLCSQDQRPVDGPLTTLTIQRKDQDRFAVDLRTESYNRIEHRVMVDNKDLGHGFIGK